MVVGTHYDTKQYNHALPTKIPTHCFANDFKSSAFRHPIAKQEIRITGKKVSFRGCRQAVQAVDNLAKAAHRVVVTQSDLEQIAENV